MKLIENYLTIVIATYNRARLLEKTLKQLADSPVKKCKIVIQNNHSTDDTIEVVDSFRCQFGNIQLVTHPVNIGANANLTRASEYCDTEYLWILADDDEYSFEGFDDVAEALYSEKYDLIQVGAHCDSEWNWGVSGTPRDIISKGYNYFKYSSFLPCTIFRTSYFNQHLLRAYHFIYYSYIHMATLLDAYETGKIVYVSKHRIVKAIIGNQDYNNYVPIRGFVLLSTYMSTRREKNAMITCQYGTRNLARCFLIWNYRRFIPSTPEGNFVNKLIYDACTLKEKIIVSALYVPMLIHRYIKKH